MVSVNKDGVLKPAMRWRRYDWVLAREADTKIMRWRWGGLGEVGNAGGHRSVGQCVDNFVLQNP